MLFEEADKPESRRILDIRSFISVFLTFWSSLLFMAELSGKMFLVRVPHMPEEVIEGSDAGNISRGETAEDRIKRTFFQLRYPVGDGSDFQL